MAPSWDPTFSACLGVVHRGAAGLDKLRNGVKLDELAGVAMENSPEAWTLSLVLWLKVQGVINGKLGF